MIASDVASLLMFNIHKYTDMFSDVVAITSIQNVGNTAVIQTSSAHNLVAGDAAFIVDVKVPMGVASVNRAGTVGTLVTSIDHDLTLPIAPTIQLQDSADVEFNGTFEVITIPNRRTIRFKMADLGPLTTTGTKILSAERYDQSFNGLRQVSSVIDPLTFQIENVSNIDATAISGKVKTNLRVSAAATIDRAIDSYTKQNVDKAWIFVVLGDAVASKSRRTDTDLTANVQGANWYRQQVQEFVSVYVISNTKDTIAGRKIRDAMQGEIFRGITRSVLFHRFPSNFYAGHNDPLMFTAHAVHSYDGAIYVHRFDFEAAVETDFNDTVGVGIDVAFRDINLTQHPNLGGTGFIESLIDLDDEAL